MVKSKGKIAFEADNEKGEVITHTEDISYFGDGICPYIEFGAHESRAEVGVDLE